jgi:hypothetical protein
MFSGLGQPCFFLGKILLGKDFPRAMIDKSSLPGILWGDAGKRDGYLYSLSEKSPWGGFSEERGFYFWLLWV